MSIPFISLIYLITNVSYFLVLVPKEVLASEAVALVRYQYQFIYKF